MARSPHCSRLALPPPRSAFLTQNSVLPHAHQYQPHSKDLPSLSLSNPWWTEPTHLYTSSALAPPQERTDYVTSTALAVLCVPQPPQRQRQRPPKPFWADTPSGQDLFFSWNRGRPPSGPAPAASINRRRSLSSAVTKGSPCARVCEIGCRQLATKKVAKEAVDEREGCPPRISKVSTMCFYLWQACL
ncbi:hypothetical protein GOP47_0028673 [Adiantum capillus-veneris]|nr:hypothetical protein GOP47_0028673 [Adiantum capillus-veneris]